MAETDLFVPRDTIEQMGEKADVDPSASITIFSNVNNLLQQKRRNEITHDEFVEQVKPLLGDSFDEKLYRNAPSLLNQTTHVLALAKNEQGKAEHNKKMKYINSLLPEGQTISNEGMDMKDFFKQWDYSRSITFMGRKNKFLEDFPDGAYTQMSLPLYDDEKIEVFKKDKNDINWNFRLPYGRDRGEWGVASSQVFNARNIMALLAAAGTTALTRNPAGFYNFAALVAGDYAGQQFDKTLEQIRGYGELEYEGDAGVGTLYNYFTNILSTDMAESLAVGGAGVFLNRIVNWFTKGDRSKFGLFGVNKNSQRFIDAYEELQKQGYELDPIIWAQIASWPLIRATFFQAKDFVDYPKQVLGGQTKNLFQQFKKFGLDLSGTGKGITEKQLIKLSHDQEIVVGNLLQKVVKATNPVEKDQFSKQLMAAMKDWDVASVAIEKQLAKAATKIANNDNISIAFAPVKNLVKSLERGWPTGTVKGPPLIKLSKKQLKILDDANQPFAQGEILSKDQLKILKNAKLPGDKMAGKYTFYPPSPVTVQKVPEALKPIFKIINRLDDTLWRAPGKQGVKNWDSVTDQLLTLRSQLMPLTTHKDAYVRDAAREIWKKLNTQMKDINGASEAFHTVWGRLLTSLDENDMVRQTVAMQQVVSAGDLDASLFVSRFLDPNMPNNIPLMLKIVGGKGIRGGEKEALENIKNVQSALMHNISHDPLKFGTMLDDWIKGNPEGLAQLLGGGTDDVAMKIGQSKINELKAIRLIADKYDNSIVNEALRNIDEFSPKAFINLIQKKAAEQGVNTETSIMNLIKDLGGVESKNLDTIRGGIIATILKKATDNDLQRMVYEASGDTVIDPKKLFIALEDLADDSILGKFFTKDHMDIIQNFDKYSQIISAIEDVGGKIAAGAARAEIAAIPTKPFGIIKTARTLLGYKLMSYILGNKMTASALGKVELDLTTKAGLAAFRNLLAVALGEMTATKIMGPSGEDVDKGTLMDFVPRDALSNAERSIQKKFEEAEQGAYPGSETDKLLQQIDRTETSDVPDTRKNLTDYLMSQNKSIPDGSRLGQTNIFNTPTYDRGKQLFTGRDEITFANQGGIMSTNKAFQRVA